eukprot:5430006-Alexandrium_andersonii.AAC.1
MCWLWRLGCAGAWTPSWRRGRWGRSAWARRGLCGSRAARSGGDAAALIRSIPRVRGFNWVSE